MALTLGSLANVSRAFALLALGACEPKLVVGTFSCNGGEDAAIPDRTATVAAPWSTSFEEKDCDYRLAGGYCYADSEAGFEVVTSPVHSGRYAMAFHVGGNDGGNDVQARCVRQGALPEAAYYGAWYYVPNFAINNNQVWNLFHFRGADTAAPNGLWDISLVNDKNQDDVEVVVYNFLNGAVYPSQRVPIPIGAWFHLELYIKRASDKTGEAALYQDGIQLFDIKHIVSDNGSTTQQWYVGNYSTGLTPPDSVVYVDDVTITEAR